ncbi:MAG: transposase [Planctomycetota bacterium]|nr:transposase [Planctomycetota bacterium]
MTGPDHNLNIGQLRGEQRYRMLLPVFEFLRRILQHVLPPRLQKIRHYDFLSRRSNIDLDDLRAAILESLRDPEPDLELEDCRVPPFSQKGTSHHRETSWPAKVPRVETDQNRARSPSTPTETPSCRVRFCRNFPMCKSTQPSRVSVQKRMAGSPQIKKPEHNTQAS